MTQINDPGSDRDYLQRMFSKAESTTVCAALSAASIPDLLSLLGLGPITEYWLKGDTQKYFCYDPATTHFFYKYESPDTVAKDFTDAGIDDEEDDEECEQVRETFKVDLSTSAFTTGLVIAFNDETCTYEVDEIYVVNADCKIDYVSCENGNEEQLGRFFTAFSLMTIKLINDQPVSEEDIAAMQEFYTPPGLTGQAPKLK
jgi:hypothetical protein